MLHAVAVALRAMREQCAEIKGIGPNGTDIVFRLESDLDVNDQAPIKSVLSLRSAPSETDAVVPYTLTEEVTVHPDGGRDPLEIVDLMTAALSGVAYHHHDRCVIQDHSPKGACPTTGWSSPGM